jgi:hypothetical protein
MGKNISILLLEFPMGLYWLVIDGLNMKRFYKNMYFIMDQFVGKYNRKFKGK